MASTNYTITGKDFELKTPFGDRFDTGGLALVQWDVGYEPRYHPLQEWTGNPVNVSWTGWFEANHFGVGRSLFGSNGTPTVNAGPLYLFIDFGNSTNANPAMYGQVWMGQITDVLTLPGGNVEINLNEANIRPVVGSIVGSTLISQDFNTWTPQAVPEPSYAWPAGLLFLGVAVARFMRAKQPHKTTQGSEGKLPPHTS